MDKQIEIDVEHAAGLLAVSERMVRMYIDERRLKALKVGKKWYIDLASVEALMQSRPAQRSPEETVRSGSHPEALPMRPTGHLGPWRLAPFRLFSQWVIPDVLSLSGDKDGLLGRVRSLRWEVLSELGAGFYSYGQDKTLHYQRARAAVGGILGLIYGEPEEFELRRELSLLEHQVLPAFSSLLKAIDKSRKRSPKAGVSSHEIS
jgi:excisionase family DNA binding protein